MVLAASQGGAGTQSGMGPQTMQQRVPGMAQMPMMRQMQHLHEQMAKIRSSDDPKERRKLLEEHMENMHGTMGTQGSMMASKGMGQGAMQGQGMMGPGAMPMQPGMSGQIEQRMDMMQERIDTMQMLMDQMMQNQNELLKTMPGMDTEQ